MQNSLSSTIDTICQKLQLTCPAEIALYPFDTFREKTRGMVNWGEAKRIYETAQTEQDRNLLHEKRIFAYANPLLKNAVRLGTRQMLGFIQGYSDLLGNRADNYAAPGSVASMFSPAAYLTELYREAKNLHDSSSIYYLDKRRPDLASLMLSQKNMDEEISTLALSNELCLAGIETKTGKSQDEVMDMLSTYRLSGETPYHHAYETVREIVHERDPGFRHLSQAPIVAAKLDPVTLLGISSHISPELYNLLIEEIPEKDEAALDTLYKTNFGDITTAQLMSPSYLARYYGVSPEDIAYVTTSLSHVGYSSDILVIPLVDGAGKMEVVRVTRTPSDNYTSQTNYIELYPQGGDNYLIKYNLSNSFGLDDFYLQYKDGSADWAEIAHNPYPDMVINQKYESQATIKRSDSDNILSIGLQRWHSGSYNFAAANFKIDQYSPKAFLLKMNKAIRLLKATGLSFATLERIVDSVNSTKSITVEVLNKVYRVKFYIDRYGISEETAAILANINISQQAVGNQLSQFEQLFNHPPLNGIRYEISEDNSKHLPNPDLNLKPDSTGDDQRKAVLKRAFQVNASELYQMLLITDRKEDGVIKNNLENLSDLYLVSLLAQIHNLTIAELNILLVICGYGDTNIYQITDDNLAKIVETLLWITQWLKTQKWTVTDLFLMTTATYSTTLTPEISNLTATLSSTLHGKESLIGEDLKRAMAPCFTSALHLTSQEVAYDLLLWIDQIQPAQITVDGFWKEVQTTPTSLKVITFAQVLAQLSLIYRRIGLSETELSLIVTQSSLLVAGKSILDHGLLTLMALEGFHTWVNGLGQHASLILAALKDGALTVTDVAQAMNKEESLLQMAANQVEQDLTKLTSWTQIDAILQWLQMSSALAVSPLDLAGMMALKYGIDHNYAAWQAAAAALMADHANQAQKKLDETFSKALCNYYINAVVDSAAGVRDRDGLYTYLLIDNQVSADVITSRIAEAIAGIQLYVNRALNRDEGQLASDVSTRQFFTDWERYNKRYSTWTGVSELVYYPENYVDPTQRIGQTKMMDALLQSINQSQLNADTVEDAFKTYLTSFEQVANLKVISAYHDNVNVDQGLTYFIGIDQAAPGTYYWRSVDHSKCENGKFAANAWGEWNKITCAVNPWKNIIRPVVYMSRLYLLWLEQQTKKSDDGKDTIYQYNLKLAHIRYDGSWNTPFTFDVTEKVKNYTSSTDAAESLGLYCTGYQGEDTLLVMFYSMQSSYSTYTDNNAPATGLYIFADMSSDNMTNAQATNYWNNSYPQFDTVMVDPDSDNKKVITRRVNNRYAEDYEIPSSVTSNSGYSWGDYSLTMLYGGSVPSITFQSAAEDLKLSTNMALSIIHNGAAGGPGSRREQCNLMKHFGGVPGCKYILCDITQDTAGNGEDITALFQRTTPGHDSGILVTSTANTDHYYVFQTPSNQKYLTFKVGGGAQRYAQADDWYDDFESYNYVAIGTEDYGWWFGGAYLSNAISIDTSIDSSKVKVTVKAGGDDQIFTADNSTYVPQQPAPSFEEMIYQFNNLTIDCKNLNFIDNQAHIEIDFTATAQDGRFLGSETFIIPVTKKVLGTENVIALYSENNGVQYMQIGAYRTRLNTLFAQQLVSRANRGIDAVLSMETQNIQEPQLGVGTYVQLVLDKYDESIHGTNKSFAIEYTDIFKDGDNFVIYQGELSETSQTVVKVFLPYFIEAYGNKNHLWVRAKYQKETTDKILFDRTDEKDPHGWFLSDDHKTFSGLSSAQALKNDSEPMDFSGANALYFWELFYYTPMMMAHRLLQEQNFDAANHWFRYVWSPSGYIVDGKIAIYHWNVRPLEEDTSWNAQQLDSTDPDAVAQDDPMHYKVATFMATLDLLMARGDAAYRQLERDTLAEAKMWYTQALNLLGDEPQVMLSTTWANPTLGNAASKTTQQVRQQVLTQLRLNSRVKTPLLGTANSLTALFLPQENSKLKGYWRTLAQRMFNLRHNLSIDGQPLSLPLYAKPADPKALLSAAVSASQGGADLPKAPLTIHRFPQMLEGARGLVNQLIQFGSSLLGYSERQDAEAMSQLLQTQASELILTSIRMQDNQLAELDSEKTALQVSLAGVQQRFDSYSQLYEENINAGEQRALALRSESAIESQGAQISRMAGAGVDMAPNIFGLADGGMHYGAIAYAIADGIELSASAKMVDAEKVAQSEIYRRRRQEWKIQRDNAQAEINQLNAQLESLSIRREAAEMQKEYLKTQQAQAQAQLTFLRSKFSNQALYSWLRGRLSGIYFQFYDLAVSRCLMAEQSYQWEANDNSISFVKPGAWQGTYAGLLCGEALIQNLAQMEEAYLKWESRALEVERTVSLAVVYDSLEGNDRFNLAEQIPALLDKGEGTAGTKENGLSLANAILSASVKLSDLKLGTDYPDSIVGSNKVRRIKQISVSLPALVGPYQDVQAMLSYGGSTQLPKGCSALAVSHGTNDSGQFQLDFNDGKYLPFEGIALDDQGTLNLQFPNATDKQQAILQTMSDIILHIRYTIR
ncbi:insecticidal toxin complex protein TcbA [Photorhabdus hindustanensis]|uniref:Toxin n=1 Tax=Photorhabdus hindustanensis TaxID=2918802 RepID=A0A2S8PZV0_9GAMM|nr:insecticidal toxin complex protein TcbA [Photorhabdus hindustanensis]PQQ24884.1 toxin [Photorhabdus hindustanensis]